MTDIVGEWKKICAQPIRKYEVYMKGFFIFFKSLKNSLKVLILKL